MKELLYSRNSSETQRSRNTLLSALTSAVLGFALLQSDGTASHTQQKSKPIVVVVNSRTNNIDITSSCRAKELPLGEDLHISEVLGEIIKRIGDTDSTRHPLPSGLSLSAAQSFVWNVASKMNIAKLPINTNQMFSRRNIGPFREMDVKVLKPTSQLREVHAIAQNFLPSSFFTSLCDRPTILYDVTARVEDSRRDLFGINLKLGKKFINYVDGGSYNHDSDQRNIKLKADFIFEQGESQIYSTEWAIGSVVHELMHAHQKDKTPVSVVYYGNELLRNRYGLDPYTAEMLQILGIIYRDENGSRIAHIDTMMEMMAHKGFVKRIINDSGQSDYERTSYFGYGVMNHDILSSPPLGEFLPVAGHLYLSGKAEFIWYYGSVFGNGAAVALYEYMKTTFFAGREFGCGEMREISTNLVKKWESE